MTPQELRHRRLHLGLSRDQLAQTVGVPIEEVAGWEEGASPITCPSAVEQILRKREQSIREHAYEDEARAS